MPELILRSGKRAGRRLTLPNGDVVIGRDDGCRIRLTSTDVSRRHCLLRCAGFAMTAVDLGSRNGTYVNDLVIAGPTPLRPGDLLRVGPFLFQVPGGPAPAANNQDEDITGWLTEEGTVAEESPADVGNDTALMERPGSTPETTELRLGSVGRPEAASAAPESPNAPPIEAVDPVVAQAADAIRAYWAAKRAEA